MAKRLRRSLIGAAGGALLCALAGPGLAQGVRRARLAMFFMEPMTGEEIARHPTIERLAELGWTEGRNLAVERAFANADREILAEMAERVVRGRPDVVWVDEFDNALAVARATRAIPIVFCGVWQPVEQGLVDSFARPGRNVTGVANGIGAGTTAKRMELLKEIVPSAKRLAWIFPGYGLQTADGKLDLAPLRASAQKLGYEPSFYPVSNAADLEAAFRAIRVSGADVLSVGSNPTLILHRERIVSFANSIRLPSAFLESPFVESGGLLSFGPDRVDARRKTADYIDRILRGANPATMPVEQPQRFSIAINLRTAKLLGLVVPRAILLQADRVIE